MIEKIKSLYKRIAPWYNEREAEEKDIEGREIATRSFSVVVDIQRAVLDYRHGTAALAKVHREGFHGDI